MPNLQNFLEHSDLADLLHKGLQGLCWKLNACVRAALWKKSIPVGQDLSVMDLELRLPAWILIPNNGKRLSLKGTRKKFCPARNELAFTVLRLYGFPSTDFPGFCVKKVSTWLTILPAPWFQVRLEFFSPSSTLKSDVNGWLFYS